MFEFNKWYQAMWLLTWSWLLCVIISWFFLMNSNVKFFCGFLCFVSSIRISLYPNSENGMWTILPQPANLLSYLTRLEVRGRAVAVGHLVVCHHRQNIQPVKNTAIPPSPTTRYQFISYLCLLFLVLGFITLLILNLLSTCWMQRKWFCLC